MDSFSPLAGGYLLIMYAIIGSIMLLRPNTPFVLLCLPFLLLLPSMMMRRRRLMMRLLLRLLLRLRLRPSASNSQTLTAARPRGFGSFSALNSVGAKEVEAKQQSFHCEVNIGHIPPPFSLTRTTSDCG